MNEKEVLEIEDRLQMARDPNTSAHILSILANDEYWVVRRAVAENPNVSVHTFIQVAYCDGGILGSLKYKTIYERNKEEIDSLVSIRETLSR
jgi:hypothetical protein